MKSTLKPQTMVINYEHKRVLGTDGPLFLRFSVVLVYLKDSFGRHITHCLPAGFSLFNKSSVSIH